MSEPEGFNELVGYLDYPMLIVTAARGDERAGCLVGFHTQCSIDPARFLVCISHQNHTFALAARSELLAVHFLDETHRALAKLFGEQTGDTADKFSKCRWRDHRGLPILDDVKAWLIGHVLQRVDLGDHIAHVIEPVETFVAPDLRQLAFQRVKGLQPGHPA
jgi:flavin reductase (DIM6/NTAB) family NADH-FMN oxidoreductase RutF